ncbi:MAG TPA: type II toxin-antitoxin system Phd/YefM family antitoxin [Thermoanaerobaculia bacterium]|nr:type II toxin-antitoxin system Phd/YefM family antitoxin [Thermoanaerobaculia bacterium]
MTLKMIPAAQFKARCLKIMDEVKSRRETVVITKKGRPVARLLPVEEHDRDVFGCLAGELEIVGDITSPVVAASAWKVSRHGARA